jgi:hypothetical protein
MLRATVSACSQASAVFRADPTWDMYYKDDGSVGLKHDKIAQWADDIGGEPEHLRSELVFRVSRSFPFIAVDVLITSFVHHIISQMSRYFF